MSEFVPHDDSTPSWMDGLEMPPLEIRRGRRTRFKFVQVPHWVVLLPKMPHAAFKLYVLLLAHANQERGDGEVFPFQETLAEIMGYAGRTSLPKPMKWLVRHGLVDISEVRYGTNNSRRRNIYVVHEEPLPGWKGFASLQEFYIDRAAKQKAAKEAAKAAKAAADAAKTDGQGDAGAPPAAKPARPGKRAGRREVALPSDVLRIIAAYPQPLREAMKETAHTDSPKTLVTAVTRALESRTVDQLLDRVARRWWMHGYEKKFEAGELMRPVGVAVAMMKHGSCPDPDCEDGRLPATGEWCQLCIERGHDYRAAWKRTRKAQKVAAEAAARRTLCPKCEQDKGTDGGICPPCVTGLENEVAEALRNVAADAAAMPRHTAEHVDLALETAKTLVKEARAQASQDGADLFGELLAAQMAAQACARDAHQLRMATMDDQPQGEPAIPAQAGVPAAEQDLVPCEGSRWDGSACGRPTGSEDGLCRPCRIADRVRLEGNLTTAG
ncbi:helix-turn-helix domain-containing protein [Kitasatospora indigofera]|uniref:helix-turn-helix domain-containing protein n=1 Tax=Kitasatospora indigofera TaxID=67307 RepID=UPI0036804AD0